MAVTTTLASCSTSAGGNGPDGSTDAPSTLDDSIRYALSFIAQIRDAQHEYATVVSGTNTITASLPSNPTAYVVGKVYRFVASNANTGAVTLNFNSLGAKSLLKVGNAALAGGELQATGVYEVCYDGVNFQLVGMYGFKGSLASSGWTQLPNGLILQWGTGTTSSGTGTVTFPTAFTTACYAVEVIENAASGWSTTNLTIYGTGSKSTTGVTVRSFTWTGSSFSAGGGNFDYITLGK